MKSARFAMSLSLVVLLIIGIAPTTNAQYPKWLYGATGFAKALEVQRELNVSLVVYFYTDWCPYCRTLTISTSRLPQFIEPCNAPSQCA